MKSAVGHKQELGPKRTKFLKMLIRCLKTMRLILLMMFFCSSFPSFGQDSSQILDTSPTLLSSPVNQIADTTSKLLSSPVDQIVFEDSTPSSSKTISVKKKKPGKKMQKDKVKANPVQDKEEKEEETNPREQGNDFIIAGLLTIAIVGLFSFFLATTRATDKKVDSSQEEDLVSDYLSRMLLSRREYYRTVYLKSEAWQRKRYVVLKRDNWRCVYCGSPATEVHHTRYAKKNIGKEPIEWLVSICHTCHQARH